jgi:hypothetical protein
MNMFALMLAAYVLNLAIIAVAMLVGYAIGIDGIALLLVGIIASMAGWAWKARIALGRDLV